MERRIQNINPNKVPLDLIIFWRGNNIKLGEFKFGKNGSFYFSSPQFDKVTITTGNSEFQKGNFNITSVDNHYQASKGFHLSLHPPNIQYKLGTIQIKISNPSIPIDRIGINWFPIIKPHKLFHFFTMPLDLYKKTIPHKQDFYTPISDMFNGSLEIICDLLPIKDGFATMPKYTDVVWNFLGYASVEPYKYAVHIRLILTNQRLSPQIHYPKNEQDKKIL